MFSFHIPFIKVRSFMHSTKIRLLILPFYCTSHIYWEYKHSDFVEMYTGDLTFMRKNLGMLVILVREI